VFVSLDRLTVSYGTVNTQVLHVSVVGEDIVVWFKL
jgi:hypothetical protein